MKSWRDCRSRCAVRHAKRIPANAAPPGSLAATTYPGPTEPSAPTYCMNHAVTTVLVTAADVISDRTLKALAYLAHQDIERHRRDNESVPLWLREAQAELSRELAARGHQSSGAAPEPVKLETVAERAHRTGQSERTVRRHAEADGGKRVGRDWIFER